MALCLHRWNQIVNILYEINYTKTECHSKLQFTHIKIVCTRDTSSLNEILVMPFGWCTQCVCEFVSLFAIFARGFSFFFFFFRCLSHYTRKSWHRKWSREFERKRERSHLSRSLLRANKLPLSHWISFTFDYPLNNNDYVDENSTKYVQQKFIRSNSLAAEHHKSLLTVVCIECAGLCGMGSDHWFIGSESSVESQLHLSLYIMRVAATYASIRYFFFHEKYDRETEKQTRHQQARFVRQRTCIYSFKRKNIFFSIFLLTVYKSWSSFNNVT